MDYQIAKIAAQWWIDQMTKQCMSLYPCKVIRKDSCLVIVDEHLQKELSQFEELLFNEILYHIRFETCLSLTCFYWPSGDLKILVKKSRISSDYLPPRANMLIHDGYIEVSLNGEDLRKLPLPAK